MFLIFQNSFKKIKTDNYDMNLKKYIQEGETWLKKIWFFRQMVYKHDRQTIL